MSSEKVSTPDRDDYARLITAPYTAPDGPQRKKRRRPDTSGGHGLPRTPRYAARRARAGPAVRRGCGAAPGPAPRGSLGRPGADRRLRRGPLAGAGDSRGGTRQPDRDGRREDSGGGPGELSGGGGGASQSRQAARQARRHRPRGLGGRDPAPPRPGYRLGPRPANRSWRPIRIKV